MSRGNILIGALAGVAAGAMLGILLAPDKGAKTRKKLSKLKSDTTDDVKEKVDEIINSASQKFDALKKEAFKMRDKLAV
ncbi:MAG: YtxH domain-containing protein [Bacteroidota bacterium]